jgi:hypothetical protein
MFIHPVWQIVAVHMENDEKWQHFQHVADIGFRGFRVTPEEAFSQASGSFF